MIDRRSRDRLECNGSGLVGVGSAAMEQRGGEVDPRECEHLVSLPITRQVIASDRVACECLGPIVAAEQTRQAGVVRQMSLCERLDASIPNGDCPPKLPLGLFERNGHAWSVTDAGVSGGLVGGDPGGRVGRRRPRPLRSQRRGAVGWVIVAGLLLVGVSGLLVDLCLHQVAVTSAQARAVLRRYQNDPIP